MSTTLQADVSLHPEQQHDKDKEKVSAIRLALRMVIGLAFYGALLFIPAGSFAYTAGWIFLGTMLLMFAVVTPYFYRNHQDLLRRRMKTKEKEKEQKLIMGIAALGGFGAIIVCGLDFRFGWSQMPIELIIAGNIGIFLSYMGVCWVLIVNEFAGRTIEVDEGQKVISTGPYAWVRHPMYSFVMLVVLAFPFGLGSYYALPIFVLVFGAVFHLRMVHEEKFLHNELEGYTEYTKKVKSRIIPFIW